MLVKTVRAPKHKFAPSGAVISISIVLVCVAIALIAFQHSLLELVRRWDQQEEYRHGYIIPFISVWLLWSRRHALMANIGRPSWVGPVLILLAAIMQVIGKLSALFILSQTAFIVVLIGIALSFGGYPLLRTAFVPIVYLVFAIPLPYFIDAVLSFQLQIISSQLGVFFIRLLNIPVYLEGNVIDLGTYKLQVVEACSGLRYLYPLLSLGFLAAYLFQAPLWQRAIVFLSTIPITILMNSLRIALVGVLGSYWGPQDAEGLLHMFEGWSIFIACTFILITEMALLARFALGRPLLDVFYPPSGPAIPAAESRNQTQSSRYVALAACLSLVCATGLITHFVTTRTEIIPERKLFAGFPITLGDWRGRPSSLDRWTEANLGQTDYILSNYAKQDGRAVNLYVIYYASQRTGSSPHSPTVCIPGNGWSITEFRRSSYRDNASNFAMPLNRAIVARQSERQLVYYWYEERGLKVANEYWSKLYLLRDALFRNRTDGALVRLTTPIYPDEEEAAADKRLQEFLKTVVPQLDTYLPSENTDKNAAKITSFRTNHS